MNDLISRKAAADELRAYLVNDNFYEDDENVMGYNDGIKCGLDVIFDLDAVNAGEWVPCSERLPEVNGRYLVTRGLNACGSLWNRIYIANYSDLMGLKSEKIWWNGNVGKSDFERIDDVIAWMPLPEPYEEGQNEEGQNEQLRN